MVIGNPEGRSTKPISAVQEKMLESSVTVLVYYASSRCTTKTIVNPT